ncbi:unnamed protein product [Lota lota]
MPACSGAFRVLDAVHRKSPSSPFTLVVSLFIATIIVITTSSPAPPNPHSAPCDCPPPGSGLEDTSEGPHQVSEDTPVSTHRAATLPSPPPSPLPFDPAAREQLPLCVLLAARRSLTAALIEAALRGAALAPSTMRRAETLSRTVSPPLLVTAEEDDDDEDDDGDDDGFRHAA